MSDNLNDLFSRNTNGGSLFPRRWVSPTVKQATVLKVHEGVHAIGITQFPATTRKTSLIQLLCRDGTLCEYDLKQMQIVASTIRPHGARQMTAMSSMDTTLVSGGADGSIVGTDARLGTKRFSCEDAFSALVVVLDAREDHIVAVDIHNNMKAFLVKNGKLELTMDKRLDYSPSELKLVKTGGELNVMATCRESCLITFYTMESHRLTMDLPGGDPTLRYILKDLTVNVAGTQHVVAVNYTDAVDREPYLRMTAGGFAKSSKMSSLTVSGIFSSAKVAFDADESDWYVTDKTAAGFVRGALEFVTPLRVGQKEYLFTGRSDGKLILWELTVKA